MKYDNPNKYVIFTKIDVTDKRELLQSWLNLLYISQSIAVISTATKYLKSITNRSKKRIFYY